MGHGTGVVVTWRESRRILTYGSHTLKSNSGYSICSNIRRRNGIVPAVPEIVDAPITASNRFALKMQQNLPLCCWILRTKHYALARMGPCRVSQCWLQWAEMSVNLRYMALGLE